MAADPVTAAHSNFQRAEQAIADAEITRDDALAQLESVLADRGWRRMVGAFAPGATRLYQSQLYPGAHLTVEQVITNVEQLRRAAT